MPTDSIGFPTPQIVKGYACLTGEEVAMAKKGINPAHPHEGTGGPQDVQTTGQVAFSAQRLDAVRQTVTSQASRLTSYAPGAVRSITPIETGTVFATQA